MSDQEYGLKFTQLSRYASHMVADSRAQMSKFLFGVSDLVKTEYMNVMLLGDMDISRLMLSMFREISLGKFLRTTRSLERGIMNTLSKGWAVEISHSFSKGLQPHHLYQLVLHPQVSTRQER